MEVIGVGQDQLDVEFFQVARGNGFDASCRAYRSENGRRDVSVRCMQDSGSCIAIGRDKLKIECHSGTSVDEFDVCLVLARCRCHFAADSRRKFRADVLTADIIAQQPLE